MVGGQCCMVKSTSSTIIISEVILTGPPVPLLWRSETPQGPRQISQGLMRAVSKQYLYAKRAIAKISHEWTRASSMRAMTGNDHMASSATTHFVSDQP